MILFKNLREIQACKKPGYDWWTTCCQDFSAYILALFQFTPITPNHITIGSLFAAIGGGYYATQLGLYNAIAAALLIQLSFVFDCADGQYARYTKIFSPLGAWLDIFIDRLREFAIIVGLTVRFSYEFEYAWVFGIFAQFLLFLYHGEANSKLPFSDDADKAEAKSLERGIISKIMRLRERLNIGAFYIGEQYLLMSLFMLFNRVDLFFYVFCAYGSAIVFLYPFYKYYHYTLIQKKRTKEKAGA